MNTKLVIALIIALLAIGVVLAYTPDRPTPAPYHPVVGLTPIAADPLPTAVPQCPPASSDNPSWMLWGQRSQIRPDLPGATVDCVYHPANAPDPQVVITCQRVKNGAPLKEIAVVKDAFGRIGNCLYEGDVPAGTPFPLTGAP